MAKPSRYPKSRSSGAKKVTKKKVIKSRKKAVKSEPLIKPMRATKRKINLVLSSLLFFLVLAIISIVLFSASQSLFFLNLFFLLALLFSFLSLAFFLSFLVLLFMKLMKR